MSKLLNYFPLLIVFLLVILAFTPYIGGFAEKPPFHYANSPFETDRKEYKAGDMLFIKQISVCSEREAQYNVTTRLVSANNGEIYVLPDVNNVAQEGCHAYTGFSRPIPTIVKPGRYYVENFAIFEGKYKKFYVPSKTQEFIVR